MGSQFQPDIATISDIPIVPAILDVISRMTGMGFAAVARLKDGRAVVCGQLDAIGFGSGQGGEIEVEIAIRQHASGSLDLIVIDDVAKDDLFRNHPAPVLYDFQSYISMPIVLPDGEVFGTLCALDRRPARPSRPEVVGMFRLFADLLALQINAARNQNLTQTSIIEKYKATGLNDQFIAVLGHDLRNPLAAISAGTNLLMRMPVDQRTVEIATLMQGSVTRMTQLIDDVLDFARGRFGGGLQIYRAAGAPIEQALTDVVRDCREAWPDRTINASFAISAPVDCDSVRIGQLLSNLVGNAFTNGPKSAPVSISALTEHGRFQLSVESKRIPLPNALIERPFSPLARGNQRPGERSTLGIDLYIASEIADAHGGDLSVVSNDEITRFTFRMACGDQRRAETAIAS